MDRENDPGKSEMDASEKNTESLVSAEQPNVSENLSQYFETWNKAGPICVVLDNPFDGQPIFDCVNSHGVPALPLGSTIFDRLYSKFIELNCGLLVLCVDGFSDLGNLIQRVMMFRKERPSVPIILISRCFSVDDISQERLALCDVSIKLPIKELVLDDYFLIAWKNNRAWVNRLDCMKCKEDSLDTA